MLSLADAPAASTPSGSTNPFPGPKPYRTEDQEFFFGRDEETDELTSLVLSTSAIVMDAPSGTGKSSLINAGLLPALEPYGFSVVPVRFGEHARAMRQAAAAPGGNPFEAAVVAAIEQATGAPPAGADLTTAMEGLRKEGSGGYVLLLDQFEEIFSGFPGSWPLRTPFFRSLARGLERNCTLRLLIAIRSDYIASLAPYQRQIPGELVVRYSLESLRAEGAKEAIRQAFEISGRPLGDDGIDGLVTGLLTLWNGETKLDVVGEFVNLIQLQIVCRGHWETAALAGADETDGENPACVDVESAMNAFVDTAVSHTVTETGCDECTIRAWLESELITPGDRRAVVLVGETTTGGLPNEIVGVLDRRRLVAFQRRNDDQWVELTHDSMIRAIHRSNGRWHEARRRRQARRRNRLALVLALLVGLFFGLRQPVDATSEQESLAVRRGVLTGGPERLEFTAPADKVTLVSGYVFIDGEVPGDEGPTLRVVRGGGGPETVVETEMTFDDRDPSIDGGYFRVSFKAAAGERYAAVLEPGGATGSAFELTVSAVPVVIAADETAADHVETINSDTFAVEVPPGAPLLVAIEDGYVGAASGAQVINDSEVIVISADDETTYAVLSVSSYGRGRVHTSRLDDDLGSLTLDQERPVITTGEAASLSFENPGLEALVIGASCSSGGAALIVYDDDERVVASTAAGPSESSTPRSSPYVVTTLPAGTYHALLVESGYEGGLRCTVGALGMGDHTLVGSVERMVPLDAGSGFDAFLVASSGESIAVVDGAPGVDHSLRCGPTGRTTLPGDDGRLIAVVSPDEECAIVLQPTGERVAGEVLVRVVPLTSATGAQP